MCRARLFLGAAASLLFLTAACEGERSIPGRTRDAITRIPRRALPSPGPSSGNPQRHQHMSRVTCRALGKDGRMGEAPEGSECQWPHEALSVTLEVSLHGVVTRGATPGVTTAPGIQPLTAASPQSSNSKSLTFLDLHFPSERPHFLNPVIPVTQPSAQGRPTSMPPPAHTHTLTMPFIYLYIINLFFMNATSLQSHTNLLGLLLFFMRVALVTLGGQERESTDPLRKAESKPSRYTFRSAVSQSPGHCSNLPPA